MSETRTGRFKDAEWYGVKKEIFIAGLGGTGSFLSVLLSRTGDHIFHLFDHDSFEEHNMAGQFVFENQINTNKAVAAKDNIHGFSSREIEVYVNKSKYTEASMSNEICFACFDNMKGRRTMYEKWKELVLEADDTKKSEFLFVDLRLLAESMTIFFVQGDKPEQFEKYEANLFDDSDVPDAECTLKQTSHAAALIASLTVGIFTNWVANKKIGSDYRDVPFRTDYLIGANLFQNEY